MKFLGLFMGVSFITYFWTTIRLPFQKCVIYYPSQNDISKYDQIPQWAIGILDHELIHVEQQRSSWGLFKSFLFYFFFPLPVFFSGRWFIEMEPYLQDIKSGRLTIDQAVNILWGSYVVPWPPCLMRSWFEKKLKE
jgi:hypothetical protein